MGGARKAKAESCPSEKASIGLHSLAASKALLSLQRSNSEYGPSSRNAMFKIAHLPDLLLDQAFFSSATKSRGSRTIAGHVPSNAVERKTDKISCCGSFRSKLRDRLVNGEVFSMP
jgi:hypothetical protein